MKVKFVSNSLGYALMRFPSRRRAIEELVLKNLEFRSLCEDYAEAEIAFERWREVPSAIGKARRTEFKELVESLAAEIAMALDQAQA